MGTHNTLIYATFDPVPFTDPESEYYNVQQDSHVFGLNINPATISFSVFKK